MRRWILGSVAALMLVLMTISSVRAGETLKDHSLSDGGTIMSESMADHQLNGGGTGRVEAGIALFWEGYGKTHVIKSPKHAWNIHVHVRYYNSGGKSCSSKTEWVTKKDKYDDYVRDGCFIDSSPGMNLTVYTDSKWDRLGAAEEKAFIAHHTVRW